MKRFLPFIILNILISAVTILVILAIWESTHRISPEKTPGPVSTPITGLTKCQSSEGVEDNPVLTIRNVIGPGNLQKEEISLEYSGIDAFCMNSWQIVDENGNRFTFPEYFQFYSNGAEVRIFSRAGTNTPLELFWGQTKPTWSSGEKVRLLDAQGKEQAVFIIP